MYTRFLTYDLNNAETEDYQDLYDLIKKYKCSKVTESTYKIETDEKWDVFQSKFKKVTHSGDNVKVIVKTEDKKTKKSDMKVWTIR
jgi:hypothetical protein